MGSTLRIVGLIGPRTRAEVDASGRMVSRDLFTRDIDDSRSGIIYQH